MRRLLAPAAVLGAALALAAPSAALDVGVTDDEGTASPAPVYAALQDLGMTRNIVSLRWDPLDPLGLPPNFGAVQAAADAAAARGVGLILATYQSANTGVTDVPDAPAVFARWLESVARACPLCARRVIVLNEPNLQFFFRPTFDPLCRPSAPAAYAQVLAAAYDSLKAVDPAIRVYGLGLSPRGNDNCFAASNVSLSPVLFLDALGKAYRAMGRDRPLMDAISFHPYPSKNTQGPDVGYRWPNVGVPNLDRLKQAFHDAFAGTAQPTIGGGAPGSTTIALDELGWQVDTSHLPGYVGEENVPTVPEDQQAQWYADVVARYACDPTVETLNFFHLRDEVDRSRWQSGLVRVDGSTRPAYDAVKAAVAQHRTCQGVPVAWQPAKRVIGARALWPRARNFAAKRRWYGFKTAADETAAYRAELLFLPPKPKPKPARPGTRAKAKPKPPPPKRVALARGDVRAYARPNVRFPRRLKPGTYRFRLTLVATMNRTRTATFTSPVFHVR